MKKVYVVAEIGNTHEGSLGLAKQFIKSAANCGVDAVKFQTHIFEAESLESAPNPPYFKDESRKEYFNRTSFSLSQWIELKRYSEEDLKVDFFSSPFSLDAVEMLERVGVHTYKIASGEVTNTLLLKKIAQTRKRVLLSSGMSSWPELDEAVKILKNNGCPDLVVLQCTSEYPCPPEQSGLNILEELKHRYQDITLGYSDHTLGIAIPLAAIVKGARVIEKHFTLSKEMYGSDAINSTEPNEFRQLVFEIRQLEIALSCDVDKNENIKKYQDMRKIFQKSIVSGRIINSNTPLSIDDLAFKKPGDGIPGNEYNRIIGMRLKNKVPKDYQFKWEDFQ